MTSPTEAKVLKFLGTTGLAPDDILGFVPERNRVFTAEKVAVNAVLAGCLPEYFPVVVAAVRGISRPEFGLHGVSASTAGAGILMVINGPVVRELGLNSGQNLMGPGNRANATIGRTLRLVLYNLAGREFDRSTLGHPGKYSFCFGEQESRWEPLHVMRGLPGETSAVTLFASEGPNQVQNHSALKPENILNTIADRMRALGSFNMGGDVECAVIICPEHYESLSNAGWEKRTVQEYLHEKACRPLADLKRGGLNESPLVSRRRGDHDPRGRFPGSDPADHGRRGCRTVLRLHVRLVQSACVSGGDRTHRPVLCRGHLRGYRGTVGIP
ncbi:MAG: hypothetical protein U5R49_19100 [Deltaproteobacteria bacterium]|nr:hypothetical protein [Deltaproteobacteria bacterium]